LSVAAVAAAQGSPFPGSPVSTETMHLTVVASSADSPATRGKRVALAFDITPKRDMHVYAPGKHDYQVITVTVDPQPWLKAQPTAYPPSEIHDFKELNEKVEVYSKPFKLVREVLILSSLEAKKALAATPAPSITGNVEYQACDDKVCYAPKKVPFKFTLDLKAAATKSK
ncbi:MAG: protein-disulfide reductase DsbD domain-containing protein, partial [Vicinamibacterales bacterium]